MHSDELPLPKRIGLFVRSLLSRYRKYPDFIITGVQKGGTTSLFAYLDQHPQLKLSRPKEVHFFDDNYQKGMRFYKRYFPLKWNQRKTGEASPYYIFHPHVADRIKAELPDVKIIILLRNPILRAYSHYHMQLRTGKEPLKTFEEAIAAENNRLQGELEKMKNDATYNSLAYKRYSYASRGMYYPQVKRWFDAFGRENVLVLKSELLSEQPEVELAKVYAFLGISNTPPQQMSRKHVAKYPEIKPETFDYLKELYLDDQARLVALLGEDFQWF